MTRYFKISMQSVNKEPKPGCEGRGKIIEVDLFYSVCVSVLLASLVTRSFSYDYGLLGFLITGVSVVLFAEVKWKKAKFFRLKSHEE